MLGRTWTKLWNFRRVPKSNCESVLTTRHRLALTSIGAGENKVALQHAAAVRELKAIGKPSHGSFDGAVEIPTHLDGNAGTLRVLVFVKISTRERFRGQQLLLSSCQQL